MTVQILVGDCRDRLKALPDGSVHCVITSPPYFGLRDYGCDGQMGLESTPDEFVAGMVGVFREVRRVLRDDGTLWLNIGDSYARNSAKGGSGIGGKNHAYQGESYARAHADVPPGLKEKDLIGIPWMLAFALRADGWYLRQDIVWSKPNPMPESVGDRCTKSHEYLFLMSKRERYFYDAEAIMDGLAEASIVRLSQPTLDQQGGSSRVPGKTNGRMKAVARKRGVPPRHAEYPGSSDQSGLDQVDRGVGRNRRSVWTVPTQPFDLEHCSACATTYRRTQHAALRRERIMIDDEVVGRRVFCSCGRHDAWLSHFATFPPDLIEDCIKAGCPAGGTVLDPFFGAGTTGLVTDRLQRDCIGIELNPSYAEMARFRLVHDGGMLIRVEVA